jgi:hypothetical protein
MYLRQFIEQKNSPKTILKGTTQNMKKPTYTQEGIKKASQVSRISEDKFVSHLCSESAIKDESKHLPLSTKEGLIKRALNSPTIAAAKGIAVVSPSGSEPKKAALARIYELANTPAY